MGNAAMFLSKLTPALRESLETLAQAEGTSVEDLLVVAIAEKVARTEHSAWLAHRRTWTATALSDRKARIGAELPDSLGDETASNDAEGEIERDRLADVFDGVPVFLAILSGSDHIFEVANHSYRELVGNRELIGKRLVDCLPELAGTVWIDRLDQVYQTGKPLVERGAHVSLARIEGQPAEDKYVDYAYKARRAADGTILGIVVLGVDTSIVQRALNGASSDVEVIALLS